jgi:hypothetical protein
MASRAPNVCQACLLRKKACSKTLPACEYCTSRRQICRYDLSAPKARRKYNPGRNFIAHPSPPFDQSPPNNSIQQQTPASADVDLGVFATRSEHDLDKSLANVLGSILSATNLSIESLCKQYADQFKNWYPVIALSHELLVPSVHETNGISPEQCLLYLSMLLMLIPKLEKTIQALGRSWNLYTVIKKGLTLWQLRDQETPSLAIVQATQLLALREYSSLRVKTAYVTIMNCIAMFQTIDPDTKKEAPLSMDVVEWSIVALER